MWRSYPAEFPAFSTCELRESRNQRQARREWREAKEKGRKKKKLPALDDNYPLQVQQSSEKSHTSRHDAN